MKSEHKFVRVLRSLSRFIVFFLLVAFVVSCCTLLFVSTLGDSMGIVFTSDMIAKAARLTMLNVLLLTALFTLIDYVRRKLTVDRPAKQIVDAGRRLMKGDFSVRIPYTKTLDEGGRFGEIAECFNRMAEELSSIETLRTDFVANVSHELKTPLAVMQSYGALLAKPHLPEEQRMEYAQEIADASCRLATLITNILKLNKLESHQISPALVRYDLSEQLCECLLAFEEVWEEKKIAIETAIAEEIFVVSDAEMLSIVWNNLLSNAIKFTPSGGTVSLTAKEEIGYAVVTVRDTGCGISQEVGRHMFDKFYQGDTSHSTEGNGLGLALVKRVIDIMGSEISVESEVGKGTAFTVKIRSARDADAMEENR